MEKPLSKTITALSWIALLLWMALIFSLSSQPAVQSDHMSKGITEKIVEAQGKDTQNTKEKISILNESVRNNAHFFLYLVLGVLVLNAFRRVGYKGFVLAFLACILYAVSDELHQIFVPGRGAELRDVLRDSAGAAIGVFLYNGTKGLVKLYRGDGRGDQ